METPEEHPMLCWQAHEEHNEECGILIAARHEHQARALGEIWMEERQCDGVLKIYRQEDGDQYFTRLGKFAGYYTPQFPEILSMLDERTHDLYYALQWTQEGEEGFCVDCQHGVFSSMPETELDDEGRCKHCALEWEKNFTDDEEDDHEND